MSVFSQRLAAAMNEKGISQSQLAKITRIPRSAINQYLSDRFMPRRERIEVISRALNVNPAWLMGLSDIMCVYNDKGITTVLSHFEYGLIMSIREDKSLFNKISDIMFENSAENIVFRAAKSSGGSIPPSCEAAGAERLIALSSAPETDDDL